MSFKFNKHEDDYGVENKTLLDYSAGQFAFFDLFLSFISLITNDSPSKSIR